ncbi:MAG: SH3 domain-containing protein [Clostridiales bacterium]|nr:SH3 domain-containing protein [Clostridiales bacterium]
MKKALLLLLVLVVVMTGCKLVPDDQVYPSPVPATDIATEAANSQLPSDEPLITEPAVPTEYVTETPVDPTETATDEPTDEPTEQRTEAVTETPKATATPAPTQDPYSANLYKCRCNELAVRSTPSITGSVIGTLHYEETVQYLGAVDSNFVKVVYNNKEGYCYGWYLVPANEKLYGYLPPQYEYQTDSNGHVVYDENGLPVTLKAELIDIRLVVPNIIIYQIFGTPENFTGQVLYERPVPVLQRDTAKKLAAAAERFAQDGYTIKVYDCYRPKSVQFILFDIVKVSRYIANPYTSASNHNRAAALDISLVDSNGKELDFPTPMHTFNELSNRTSYKSWTAEQRRNVEYMTNIMVECGFKTINSEWWHFSDSNYLSFIVLDINMKDIPMYTAAQLGFNNQ